MDLQNFTVVDTGEKTSVVVNGVSVDISVIILSAILVGENGETLADYTGVNALVFPSFFSDVPFNSDGISLYSLLWAIGPDFLGYKYSKS